MDNLWWGFWADYPKVTVQGKEYAEIGSRLFTRHAVARTLPSGRRTIAREVARDEGGGYAFDEAARSISPNNIEYVILNGDKKLVIEKGELRTLHTAGDVRVVTTRDDRIVITCMYAHEAF
jgi:filamentous hemagglutinin